MKEFKERLRECRARKKVTQEALCNELGIAYSTYRRYERGGSEPTLSDAAKLAVYFGVSLDYLAGIEDEK